MTSQKARILEWLKERPTGICSTDLLRIRIPRGAARISELRADGHLISTEKCVVHRHRTRQIRYVLNETRLF